MCPESASKQNISEIIYLGDFKDGVGEVNGNPLQHSCLENPMDGGAW